MTLQPSAESITSLLKVFSVDIKIISLKYINRCQQEGPLIMNIAEAAEILDLPDKISINGINEKYRELLNIWHPDHCTDDPDVCIKRTREIIEAYKAVMAWCCSYKFTLTTEDGDIDIAGSSPEEFWEKKFGHDPMWGYPGK